MILREKDRRHCEAIIKYCSQNGMEKTSTWGLWNNLVRLHKKIEVLERNVTKPCKQESSYVNEIVFQANAFKFCPWCGRKLS